jgi:hypothetical protein
METYLNKVISSKHLLYIIQEYLREKYTFHNELLEKTKHLLLCSGSNYFYDKYSVSFIFDINLGQTNPCKIKHAPNIFEMVSEWAIKYK